MFDAPTLLMVSSVGFGFGLTGAGWFLSLQGEEQSPLAAVLFSILGLVSFFIMINTYLKF